MKVKKKLTVKSERQIYHTLMVWPEVKEAIMAKAKKANKTVVQLLADFSKE